MDDHGHGTHVAGTIGAQATTARHDRRGLARSLMALPSQRRGEGRGPTWSRACGYARQKGLRIVNASLGRHPRLAGGARRARCRLEHALRGRRGQRGKRPVGDNNDVSRATYPCNYDLPNVVCVAATDDRRPARLLLQLRTAPRSTSPLPASTSPAASPAPPWPGRGRHVDGHPARERRRGAREHALPDARPSPRSAPAPARDRGPQAGAGRQDRHRGRLNVYRALGGIPPLPADAHAADYHGQARRHARRGGARPPTAGRRRSSWSSAAAEAALRRPGAHALLRGLRPPPRAGARRANRAPARVTAPAQSIVGRVRGRLGRAGAVTVRLKLTARARRRLRRAGALRLQLGPARWTGPGTPGWSGARSSCHRLALPTFAATTIAVREEACPHG